MLKRQPRTSHSSHFLDAVPCISVYIHLHYMYTDSTLATKLILSELVIDTPRKLHTRHNARSVTVRNHEQYALTVMVHWQLLIYLRNCFVNSNPSLWRMQV